MKVLTLLDQIDNGQTALPGFQRGCVWNRAGYLVFEEIDHLRHHVAEQILDNPLAVPPAWAHHLDDMAALPVVEWIVDKDLPEPVIGQNVEDAKGEVVGSFELAWLEYRYRVGIWNEQGKVFSIPPTLAGWRLYHLEEVRQAPYTRQTPLRTLG